MDARMRRQAVAASALGAITHRVGFPSSKSWILLSAAMQMAPFASKKPHPVTVLALTDDWQTICCLSLAT
jgi:uncharacterized membrane protein